MKIDVTQEIKRYDGQPMKTTDPNGEVIIVTLRYLCCEALTAPFSDEDLSGDEKVKRFSLAQHIFQNDKVDLKAEQIALLKELIQKGFPQPGIVGPAWLLLDP